MQCKYVTDYNTTICVLSTPPKNQLHSLKGWWSSKLSWNGRTRTVESCHLLSSASQKPSLFHESFMCIAEWLILFSRLGARRRTERTRWAGKPKNAWGRLARRRWRKHAKWRNWRVAKLGKLEKERGRRVVGRSEWESSVFVCHFLLRVIWCFCLRLVGE